MNLENNSTNTTTTTTTTTTSSSTSRNIYYIPKLEDTRVIYRKHPTNDQIILIDFQDGTPLLEKPIKKDSVEAKLYTKDEIAKRCNNLSNHILSDQFKPSSSTTTSTPTVSSTTIIPNNTPSNYCRISHSTKNKQSLIPFKKYNTSNYHRKHKKIVSDLYKIKRNKDLHIHK
jgi:hypothetical protein